MAMPKAPAKVDPAKEAAKAAAKVEKACNDLVKACKDDALSKAKKGAAAAAAPALPLCISHHLLPCHAAVESGAEIDFDATGTGSTPMHIAAGFGSYDVVNYLFSVGGLPSIEVGLVRVRARVRGQVYLFSRSLDRGRAPASCRPRHWPPRGSPGLRCVHRKRMERRRLLWT